MFLALVILLLIPLRVMANAVVAEGLIMAGGVLLIGSILAASGVKFLSQTDLLGASRTLLDKIRESDPSTWTGLTRIIAPLCQAGVKGTQHVLRLSDELWEKVIGKYKGDVIQEDAASGTVTVKSFANITVTYEERFQDYGMQPIITDANGVVWTFEHGDLFYPDSFSTSCEFYVYKNGVLHTKLLSNVMGKVSSVGDFGFYKPVDSSSISVAFKPMGQQTTTYFHSMTFPITFGGPKEVSATGTVDLPDNITHTVALPDMPTVAQDGTITYPDLPLNPEAYQGKVADLPGYDDVTSVPLDLPIDAETGKVITDLPDVPDVPDVPDIPDVPATTLGDILSAINAATSAVGSIADAITQVPTFPDAGSLSLPALIVSKFPFCIPFDAYHLVTLLDAEPVAPRFEIPFKVGPVDEVIVFDFAYFDKAIQVFRWFEQIAFVGALMYATRNFIKW